MPALDALCEGVTCACLSYRSLQTILSVCLVRPESTLRLVIEGEQVGLRHQGMRTNLHKQYWL